MKKCIVFGTGIVALGTIQAYAKAGIKVAHLTTKADDIARYSRHINEWHVLPSVPEQEQATLQFLMNGLEDWEGALLDPVNDPYVAFVSQHHDVLSRRYVLAVPPWDILRGIVDKSMLYCRAYELNVPAPATTVPESVEHIRKISKNLKYPCIIKPHQTPSFFSVYQQKVLVADTPEALVDQYIDVDKHNLEAMVSEIIPGPNTHYLIYICHISRDGDVLAEMCVQKIRQHPAEYGVGCVIKTVPMLDEIRESSLRLLRSYGYVGFSATEFKYDGRDGQYKLIEINTRPVLYIHVFRKAGINFSEIQYADKVEGKAATVQGHTAQVHWIHPYFDFYEFRSRKTQPGFSRRRFLHPYVQPKAYAIPFWDDPMPFLKNAEKFIGAAVRRRLQTPRSSKPK